jgi:transcription termination factor Rho
MKKILTLLIAFGSVASLNAQSRKIEETKRVINGQTDDRRVEDQRGTRYPDGRSGTSRQEEIDQINREYDRKIDAVNANPILSRAEKDRRIREIEAQRDRRLRSIDGGRYENDRTSNNKKNKNYKGNNGKHLGWEKGRGNPHRTGDRSREYDRRDDRDRKDDRDYDDDRRNDRDNDRGNGKSKNKDKKK